MPTKEGKDLFEWILELIKTAYYVAWPITLLLTLFFFFSKNLKIDFIYSISIVLIFVLVSVRLISGIYYRNKAGSQFYFRFRLSILLIILLIFIINICYFIYDSYLKNKSIELLIHWSIHIICLIIIGILIYFIVKYKNNKYKVLYDKIIANLKSIDKTKGI